MRICFLLFILLIVWGLPFGYCSTNGTTATGEAMVKNERDTSSGSDRPAFYIGYPFFTGLVNRDAGAQLRYSPTERFALLFRGAYRFAHFKIVSNGGQGGSFKYNPMEGYYLTLSPEYFLSSPFSSEKRFQHRFGVQIQRKVLTEDKYCYLHGGSNGLNMQHRDVRKSVKRTWRFVPYHGLSWRAGDYGEGVQGSLEMRWGIGVQYRWEKTTIYGEGFSGGCLEKDFDPNKVEVQEGVLPAFELSLSYGVWF